MFCSRLARCDFGVDAKRSGAGFFKALRAHPACVPAPSRSEGDGIFYARTGSRKRGGREDDCRARDSRGKAPAAAILGR